MSWLTRLAERQILKSQLKGGLQGLAGDGKPLPDRPGDAFVSAGDAAGFRIMAEAGALPEEITLKKQVHSLAATLATLPEGPEHRALQARISELQMRQAIAEEARRRFLKG